MSLMRLAPECVRLRRMAKAYAAGEMSEGAYRDARRAVIDGVADPLQADDDTRPRAGEPTLRGADETLRAVRRPVRKADPADPAAAPAVTVAAARARRLTRWLALTAAVLAVLLLLSWPETSRAADIPPLRDRHPDPQRSPRLPVMAVQVGWAGAPQEAPDRGNDLPAHLIGDLQAAADGRLNALRNAEAPGSHGFTPSELTEIGRFLEVLGVHEDGAGLDVADARDLAALIAEQKRRRGVSIAQLEDVAAAVQAELREAGYFLGVAYVPAQSLAGGVVRIDVMPGRLGEVVVDGGDPGPVAGVFAGLRGAPLTLDEVTRRLETLNALPGVDAQASFGPGAEPGTSALRLDLLQRRHWSAALALDNHGDDATGAERLSLTGAWLNPRGAGDRLSVGLLTTLNPSDQTFGYLDYDTPLADHYRLAARLGRNDFEASSGGAGVDGAGTYLDLGVRRALLRGRERGLTAVLGAARHQLDWAGGIDQSVSMLSAGMAGHRVWDGPRIAADAAVNATLGHVGGDRFSGQDDTFWLLELEAQMWLPLSLPLLEGEQKLRLAAAGQWSDSLLPATRRFNPGGPQRARAFERAQFLGDRGVVLGAELRTPLVLGELLLFAESSYADDRTSGAERWTHLGDIGLGWEANLGRGLVSRLSWALPVTVRGTGDPDEDDARWYWSLDYRH